MLCECRNGRFEQPDAAFLLIEFETRNGGGAEVRHQLEDFSRAHPDFKDPYQLMAVLDAAAGDEASAAKERRLASAAPTTVGKCRSVARRTRAILF